MQNPEYEKRGYEMENSYTHPSEIVIMKEYFIIGSEEEHLRFEVPNPDVNLPLFEKVVDVVEYLLAPSRFQKMVIKKAIVDEFERHGFNECRD